MAEQKVAGKKAEKKALKATERMYDILLGPVITEKASQVAEHGKVVFAVRTDATKRDIRDALETIYKVEVKSVNIAVAPGKAKRFKGIKGETGSLKKAYVTLADGQSIDIMAGVK